MISKQRQLNIRDDEIHARAHALAARLGISAKEAVRAALRAMDARAGTSSPMDQDRARHLAELDAITKRLAARARPGDREGDDRALYDADGLPR